MADASAEAFIEVHLEKMDCSDALKKLGKELRRVNVGR